MKRVIFLFLLLPFFSFSMFIQFLDFSTVTTNSITVYDVAATFTGIDATSLKNITLAYIPEDTTLDVNVKYVLQRLSRVATQIEATPTFGYIKVYFPPVLTNESTTATLTEDFAKELSKKLVLSRLPDGATVKIVSTYGSIVQHDNFDYDVIESIGGSFLVRFSLKEKGRTRGYFNVNLIAEYIRKIPVAARNINYGEQIKKGDIVYSDINILSLHGTPVDISKLPMISKKYFKIGEPIYEEYLEEIPDVVVGQLVFGYVELPGVKVHALLRAMESGNVGDVIKARNVDTGKIVYGLVVKGPMLKVVEVSK
ncbi:MULTISPECIES: flagellar basal body P-ring formation chaperone FlgA [unclassified Thermosipho (in: thermotogales)]|uniref:flagellar basal body P-ring formation chaperone FlgA n=1 Tax=unclassified Thermosipho (in: thermotogales) TaxID=2676525 RepID=UPI0009876CA9|nr:MULTISPECIES: flagellar basal body P-ring formation chaperone FlgA [unclassified Thermosipho (in: thermotogales)]MBT1247784.1 flagellar biosynthesis protein FlgA [Thermosipho sp. 1244]OOC47007.1 flagellar basal body P-ring biosynthesis protein FlgA [Thermosipho sp. 1223]